jgi:2-C-methyl-D-erythritol 2,4-cyclodiphosphate synthase
MNIRVGFGYDVHQLADDRAFWLGGILIPHTRGALGHSDADTLIHALCDALLGAAGLRDIGYHFPDTSADFKNIDSKILLAKVGELLKEQQWEIINIDSTIVLQRPRISGYIPQMTTCLEAILKLSAGQISIKAKTTEKLGFEGREEGLSAYAVALIQKS